MVIQAGTRGSSLPAVLIGLHEYVMKSRWNCIMFFLLVWETQWRWREMTCACVSMTIHGLTACLHIHRWASAARMSCSCLLFITLSDHCSPQCQSACNKGSSREDCVPCAGGRGCPLPSLKSRLLSALRRNKSLIWFVVFLTKGSWSRNKSLLSSPSAPSSLSSSQRHNTH